MNFIFLPVRCRLAGMLSLIKGTSELVRSQKIAKRLLEPNCPPLEAVAHDERITASYATRLVRLAFLAPDIVAAILAGKEPAGLTANN
jgi:site-specific DNA recombinase